MINRVELKARAKEAVKANWGACIVACIIVSIVISLTSPEFVAYNMETGKVVTTNAPGIQILRWLLTVLVANVLTVGAARFFLQNREDDSDLRHLFFGFSSNYKNIVITELIVSVCVGLWSLLLIVPGVIKSIVWSQVPYLLSENPEMSYREAMRISDRMMDGHKMEYFVMTLSFIGWILVGIATFGILLVAWTAPYMRATYAEWYVALCNQNTATEEI